MIDLQSKSAGPLERLFNYSITGSSKAMRKKMLADTYVLDRVAILGQWTTLYASPNTGKTLLVLWMLKQALEAGRIDGASVFYVNADDSYRGVVEKTELAEEWGFHMLAPNQNGFSSSDITQLMIDLAESGEAHGVVLVLDTLKKFTDLMQKKEAANFGNISRGFVSSGGTLVCLAHTNKHKSGDGRSVYSGTSDIRDDSDCVYIIEKADGSQVDGISSVEFVNDKARGDVADRLSFSYKRFSGQSYRDLIASVQCIDAVEMGWRRLKSEMAARLEEDTPYIEAICAAIESGITSKAKLVSHVNSETGLSHNKLRKLIADRTGTDYGIGHRWSLSVGSHNTSTYALIQPD